MLFLTLALACAPEMNEFDTALQKEVIEAPDGANMRSPDIIVNGPTDVPVVLGPGMQWVGVAHGAPGGGTMYSCMCTGGNCSNNGCKVSISHDLSGSLDGSCSGNCSGSGQSCSMQFCVKIWDHF